MTRWNELINDEKEEKGKDNELIVGANQQKLSI